jgi:hypothetical protein
VTSAAEKMAAHAPQHNSFITEMRGGKKWVQGEEVLAKWGARKGGGRGKRSKWV